MSLLSDDISVIHGWVPMSVKVVTALALVLAVGWRSRRWRRLWLPAAAVVGGVAAAGAHDYIADNGDRTGTGRTIRLDRVGWPRSGCPDPGLARYALVAAWAIRRGRAAVPALLAVRAQQVGRLRPDRAERMGSDHLRAVARPDRQDRRYGAGGEGRQAVARQPGPGADPPTHRISRIARNSCTCRRPGLRAIRRHSCRR